MISHHYSPPKGLFFPPPHSPPYSLGSPHPSRDPTGIPHLRRELLVVIPGLRGWQLHEVEELVEDVDGGRVNIPRLGPAAPRILKRDELELVHLLEEFLRGPDARQVLGRLRLVDAEGVPEEVHRRLHVVVPRVVHGRGLAIAVLLRAYAVDVRLLPLDNDGLGHIEEVLGNGNVQIIAGGMQKRQTGRGGRSTVRGSIGARYARMRGNDRRRASLERKEIKGVDTVPSTQTDG